MRTLRETTEQGCLEGIPLQYGSSAREIESYFRQPETSHLLINYGPKFAIGNGRSDLRVSCTVKLHSLRVCTHSTGVACACALCLRCVDYCTSEYSGTRCILVGLKVLQLSGAQ